MVRVVRGFILFGSPRLAGFARGGVECPSGPGSAVPVRRRAGNERRTGQPLPGIGPPAAPDGAQHHQFRGHELHRQRPAGRGRRPGDGPRRRGGGRDGRPGRRPGPEHRHPVPRLGGGHVPGRRIGRAQGHPHRAGPRGGRRHPPAHRQRPAAAGRAAGGRGAGQPVGDPRPGGGRAEDPRRGLRPRLRRRAGGRAAPGLAAQHRGRPSPAPPTTSPTATASWRWTTATPCWAA